MWKTKNRAIGLEINRSSIRAVAYKQSGPALRRLASEELVFDDGRQAGSRARSEALDNPLATFVRTHKFTGWNAVFSVPSNQLILRYMHVPTLPEKALRQSLELEIGNSIHLPFERPLFDFAEVPPIKALDAGMTAVCMVATPGEYVREMVEIVRQAGLRPVGVDIAPLAVHRVLAQPPNSREDALTILLQVEAEYASISVFIGPYLYFYRNIDAPGGRTGVDPSFPMTTYDLADETVRVINFFNYNLAGQERPIQQVLLYGSTALTSGVGDAIRTALGVVPNDVALLPQLHVDRSDACAVATGLAVKGWSP